MEFDFYLSEMSVSALHGGGLTLQRILGDDLDHIQHFAYVNRTAYDTPAMEKYRGKDIKLTSFWDSNLPRKLLGSTRARAISRKPFFQKLAAKRNARLLDKKFEKGKVLTALVCPQAASAVYTLEALKKYREVKYVTWVMDDHVVRWEGGKWYYPAGFEISFQKHLQDATQVFAISPVMQAFYKDRFGVDSEVLFGPADAIVNTVPPVIKQQPLKVGYFGAVTFWQMDVLAFFANALTGTDTELHIYSAIEKLPETLNFPNVHFKGRINSDQVLTTMQQYNAILLPVSFTEKMRHLSEFNIATKMSEYLASGVPILAIAPEYAAMLQYLRQHQAAIVVDYIDKKSINDGLGQLADEKKIRSILNNARATSVNETGTEPMRQKWFGGINKLLY